jgi:heptosyltransferase II
MKTLIIAPSWVGDAVMSQPLLARLQANSPGRIDVLAPAWVLPVYRRMSEVGETLASPFGHGDASLSKRWRLGREIAGRGYQRAVVLPNSLKSALVPFFAGIPERIGFTGEARFGLVNRRHRLDKAALPLMVERFAQLAEPPGGALSRPVAMPRLQSSREQQTATLAALASLSLTRPDKLAVLCPGAEYGPAKRWPTAHFARLARALADDGFAVWALGSGKDREFGETIATLSGGACRNLCGHTNLEQAIDVLAMSELVITNDSGLMHVAAAVDRPLVALFGSSSPGFTPPLTTRAEIVSLQLGCSPCFKRECPLGHLDCLNRLTPERVLEACRKTLAQA